jgi:ankyrin repeat protein
MAEKEFDAFKFLLGVSNLDITTEDGYDVLDNAIDTEQDISIIRMIVEEFRKRHKSLDRFIVDERTALHLAIERGRRYDVFELLLDNGADPLIRFPWWFEAEMDAEDTTEKGSEHGNGAEGVKSPEGPEGVMETTTSDAGVKEKTEDSGNEMRDGSVTETSAYAESPGDAVKSPNNGNYNLPADGTGNKEPSDKMEGDCDIGGENECEGAKEETEDPTTSGRQITILMYAAEHGLLDFAKKILNHPTGRGLLPDVNFGGCTALHYSTMPRNEEIVKLLLSYGADVNALDIYGRTPLHYADTVPTAEILLDNGADINVQAENGATTLHFAVMDPPHFDLFKVLLARGADYKVKDQDGLNPLDYAVSTFSLTMKAEAMYCIFKAEVRRIEDWRSSVLMTGILAVVGGLLLARFSQRRKILHASIFP